MQITNGDKHYGVGGLVAESEKYRLYLCKQEGTERQCLFQIAIEVGYNGNLDRNAFFLGELQRRAEVLELEYEKVRTRPDSVLNYQLGFPELVDSFVCLEQGGRRVNILAFRNVEDVSKMVPLSGITEKDHLRVDIRTSAWILGKLLKLLVFAHSENIVVKQLDAGNILIEPDQHYVLIFDWSDAVTFAGEIPEEYCREEISAVAEAVTVVLGANPLTGKCPDDGDPAFADYCCYVLELVNRNERSAQRAHQNFYELIDRLWPHGFHKFTTQPLNS